jgi:hypothetical protein
MSYVTVNQDVANILESSAASDPRKRRELGGDMDKILTSPKRSPGTCAITAYLNANCAKLLEEKF